MSISSSGNSLQDDHQRQVVRTVNMVQTRLDRLGGYGGTQDWQWSHIHSLFDITARAASSALKRIIGISTLTDSDIKAEVEADTQKLLSGIDPNEYGNVAYALYLKFKDNIAEDELHLPDDPKKAIEFFLRNSITRTRTAFKSRLVLAAVVTGWLARKQLVYSTFFKKTVSLKDILNESEDRVSSSLARPTPARPAAPPPKPKAIPLGTWYPDIASAKDRVTKIFEDGRDTCSGAQTLQIFVGDGRLFIIFGNVNASNLAFQPCQGEHQSVVDIMKREFARKPEPGFRYDFMFETPFVRRDEKKSRWHWMNPNNVGFFWSHANSLEWAFGHCFVPNKAACATSYPRARFHYVDINTTPFSLDTTMNGLDMFIRIATVVLSDMVSSWNPYRKLHGVEIAVIAATGWIVKNLKWYLNEILNSLIHGKMTSFEVYEDPIAKPTPKMANVNNAVKNAMMRAYSASVLGMEPPWLVPNVVAKRVAKELQDAVCTDDIINFMRKEINNIQVGGRFASITLPPKQALSKTAINVGDYVDKESLFWAWDQLSIIDRAVSGIMMDTYTLARMFKSSIVPTSSEVWFYGGEAHAQTISRFLSSDKIQYKLVASGSPETQIKASAFFSLDSSGPSLRWFLTDLAQRFSRRAVISDCLKIEYV